MGLQYKKGIVELCALALLNRRDCYGYDISDILSRYVELSEGAVYPILRKMKSDGLVTTYLSEESGGPPRKYYAMTKRGRQVYQASRAEWLTFVKNVGEILKEDES
ncbi:MAG: PadR family transcriptional regulator [Oscillospiraceae bacterium]|nr:PadR family transcriptional regulator [Oscillospiraceae bacterium]